MYKQIGSVERDLIAVLKSTGWSNKSIAKKLGRNTTSIDREIKRNKSGNGCYASISVQAEVKVRKQLSRLRHPLKSSRLFAWIIGKLQEGWSPEIISGRIAKISGKRVIATETIYTFIYSKSRKPPSLTRWIKRRFTIPKKCQRRDSV